MKISIIGPTYPYKGGISHFTTILVKNLREKHQVNFISWKRQYPSFLYPIEPKDTQSKELIKEDAKYVLDFLNPLSWIKAVKEVLDSKSDLLIITWIVPIQAPIYFLITLLTNFFTKTKILYICHNVLPHESSPFDKYLAKLAFSQADSFIVHSREDSKVLERIAKNKNIILGFLPIFDMFNTTKKYDYKKVKRGLGLNTKVLLFFGYIRPYKGLKYLIRAMPIIIKKFPDISLLVVGEFWSKDKKTYFDLVDQLGIKKNVVFINNYVPNEELGKYFGVSDVVVLPYISATQSAAIQTAYAFNKPVISTSVGGLKDVVIDGKSGYVIKTASPADIADKVEVYYHHTLFQSSIEKIKEKFSWGKYISILNDNLKLKNG